MGPRHLDLRPFAIHDGERVWVVPGGLTRVALPGGKPGRELEPGRRLEGHLGARDARRRARSRCPSPGRSRPPATSCCARPSPARCRPRTASSNSSSSSSPTAASSPSSRARAVSQQQSRSRSRRARRAEPHRGVAVLDRALHRAGRGHRAAARRPLPPPARGPVGRRGRRVRGAAARRWATIATRSTRRWTPTA